MSGDHVFISHAFVKDLREALESLGLAAWADSRELTGGDKLTPEIESNIENARQFIVVVSLNALNSTWVQNELKKALEVERRLLWPLNPLWFVLSSPRLIESP